MAGLSWSRRAQENHLYLRSVPQDTRPDPSPRRNADYEPPRVTLLGTVADLTGGVDPTSTDGLSPGSVL